MALLTFDLLKHNAPTPADDLAPQTITDCGNFPLELKQLRLDACISTLPPGSGILVSKWNKKCPFSWRWLWTNSSVFWAWFHNFLKAAFIPGCICTYFDCLFLTAMQLSTNVLGYSSCENNQMTFCVLPSTLSDCLLDNCQVSCFPHDVVAYLTRLSPFKGPLKGLYWKILQVVWVHWLVWHCKSPLLNFFTIFETQGFGFD